MIDVDSRKSHSRFKIKVRNRRRQSSRNRIRESTWRIAVDSPAEIAFENRRGESPSTVQQKSHSGIDVENRHRQSDIDAHGRLGASTSVPFSATVHTTVSSCVYNLYSPNYYLHTPQYNNYSKIVTAGALGDLRTHTCCIIRSCTEVNFGANSF